MTKSVIKKFKVSPLQATLLQPFRVATGEHRVLENILFSLELMDGTIGLGEAPIATHITGETQSQTIQNLQSVGENLLGVDANDYLAISFYLNEVLSDNKAAIAAVETALLDALTRQWKMPLWKFFGESAKIFKSDITIVIADLEETIFTAKKYYKQGFRSFKVKIGKDWDLDLKRVLTLSQITRRCPIILDANQGFSAEQTLKFVKALAKQKVVPVLLEQPTTRDDWEGLRKVTRSCKIPVCADESVRSLNEAVKAIRGKYVSAINVKLAKTGIFESREIALLSRTSGTKLMISGMMESSLAMTASAHLAAGLGCFEFVDLDTPFFIKDGRKNNPYLNDRGIYDLRAVPSGIGIRI